MTDAFGKTLKTVGDSEKAALSLATTLRAIGAIPGPAAGAFGLTTKAIQDLLESVGAPAELIEKAKAAVPEAAAAAAPPVRGGAPARARAADVTNRGAVDTTIDKLITMNEDLIKTIKESTKSGGDFVTELVVDGEKMAEATYTFIREKFDSEFKLVEK